MEQPYFFNNILQNILIDQNENSTQREYNRRVRDEADIFDLDDAL